jgi:hypothetical protein
MEIKEPKEANFRLHTQEVRGSSPCAPTIPKVRQLALSNGLFRNATCSFTNQQPGRRLEAGKSPVEALAIGHLDVCKRTRPLLPEDGSG